MNCTEAKKISIVGFLASQGIHPQSIKNGSAWYCSPLRQEAKPSFKVNQQKNIWFDYGAGVGGNLLELVMKINSTGISGALTILKNPELSKPGFSFFEQPDSYSGNIEIKHLQPLKNRALLQYIESRKITPAKAANYLQEAYYQVNGKRYFALAFENDRGGFELRNKYFKGSSSPKAPTTIPGTRKAVNIFEGFFNFLSALEYYSTLKPAGTCIILNSVSNFKLIINTLEQYEQINLYLDNDDPGELAAETIKGTHPKVKDYSKIIYSDMNDFNQFLMKKNE